MHSAIRYHRFSSKRQDKGSSIERQEERTSTLCEQKGWQIVETVEDKGQSAWKGDHLSVGNLGKLRKRIDAGLIEPGTFLVVENLDRLSRQDYRTARRWIEDVTDRGITIAVCTPELILDTAAMSGANIGPIIQHLLEANRASAESARKSEFQVKNVKRMTQLAREGVVFSPRAPQWLQGETGGKFQIVKDRAAIVRLIYEWSASGIGLGTICRKLNDQFDPWTGEGWKTGKAQWRIGYVRDILHSPAVEGEYHVRAGANRKPTGEIIRNYYPRIVDADLVERARRAGKLRAGDGGRGASEAQNLFVGLVKCDACGGAVGRVVTGNGRGGRYAYLACRNSRYGTCQNKHKARYDLLETVMLDRILHLALDDTFFVATDTLAPIISALAAARKQVTDFDHDMAAIISVLRKMPDSPALIDELATIESQSREAKSEVERLETELAIARGSATADQHVARVRELRDAINDDDIEVRSEARRKIVEAMRVLIASIGYGEKFITVELVRGIGGMLIAPDREPFFWQRGDVQRGNADAALRNASPEEKASIDAYMRRTDASGSQ